MSEEPIDYKTAWNSLRRLQRLCWMIPMVGFLLVVGIVPLINSRSIPALVGVVLILIVGVASFIALLKLIYWRCPRCGKYYFQVNEARRQTIPVIRIKACVHCNLLRP